MASENLACDLAFNIANIALRIYPALLVVAKIIHIKFGDPPGL